MNAQTVEQLKSLHTAAIDARNGYREALKDSHEGHDLVGLFQEMALLHEANAGELQGWLTGAGERENENGSFMSTVHETIMDVRSLFGGLDESVLSGLIDGEKRNVSHYDKALLAVSGEELVTVLRRQRNALQAAITKMESLKG